MWRGYSSGSWLFKSGAIAARTVANPRGLTGYALRSESNERKGPGVRRDMAYWVCRPRRATEKHV